MLVTELMKSTNYKNGNTSKEKYPDPKKYRRAVQRAKCKAEKI